MRTMSDYEDPVYGGLKTQVERSKYKVSRLQTPDLEYLPLLPLVVGRLLLLRPVTKPHGLGDLGIPEKEDTR